MDDTDDKNQADDGLGDLADQAAAFETSGQAQAEQRQAQAAAQTIAATAVELREALGLGRALAMPAFTWWPAFTEVWSDDALGRIADAGAAVMERHGWTVGETLAKMGPYIALVGALAPPSFVTYQAVKAHKAQAVEAQRRPPVAPPMPPMEMAA